ncbi:SDR family oxidoreductase [Chitinophaga sp. YIM B06452]|uniref:SDR family NAD(P)-dependent oxidoreductase n=1 Tax=Chitinophaga sp. YIM B06452 TaxID=3082158 RepID=UPI0031FEA2DB
MEKSPFSLENKVILVIGASSGIGKQIAVSASLMGAKVILLARNAERLQAVLSLLAGSGHMVIPADITDASALRRILGELPPLNGVVHSAGLLKLAPLKALDLNDLTEITKINYIAPVNLTRELFSLKKIQPGASIVFLSSVNGTYTAVKGFGAYAGSKAALNSVCKVMALEYAAKNIRFNTLVPGMIKTEMYYEMMRTVSEENIKADKLKYPMGEYGDPEDVAYGAIYLLSDASKWVTGTSLVIDGGLTIA